jgi:solute carrier family 25 phosphate transporter 23/24/25/41
LSIATGSKLITAKYLIAGGIAGALSRSITAPIDRLRVLLQISSQSLKPTVPGWNSWTYTKYLIRSVYREDGILGFWKGNGVNVLKIIPESAVRFYVFELVKRRLSQHKKYGQNTPPLVEYSPAPQKSKRLFVASDVRDRLMAGGFAGLCSQLAVYPLDTTKTRMMAEMAMKRHASEAPVQRLGAIGIAKRMYQKEGMRSFFRGLGPSLVGYVCLLSL